MKNLYFQFHPYGIKKNYFKLFLTFCILSFSSTVHSQLAFPTAKGAAASITGGRGGQVIHVTTLNATGPGSFVEAIRTEGTRIIVFDVGGTIDLTTAGITHLVDGNQNTNYHNVTVAGQTAPGGITIEAGGLYMDFINNVIFRHVRFKGKDIPYGSDMLGHAQSNTIMYDHCSFLYGRDECLSIWDDTTASYGGIGIGNVTVQHCLLGEAKTGSIIGGGNNGSGYGAGNAVSNVSILQNAYINISHRTPNIKYPFGGQIDVINNVIYNWSNRLMTIQSSDDDASGDLDIDVNNVGNIYHPANIPMNGPYIHNNTNYPWNGIDINGMADRSNKIRIEQVAFDEAKIYSGGNTLVGWSPSEPPTTGSESNLLWREFFNHGAVATGWFVDSQFPLLGQPFSIKTASQTSFNEILEDVGANAYLDDNHNKVNYSEAADDKMITEALNDSAIRPAGYFEGIGTDPNDPLYVPSDQMIGTHTGFTRPANWDTDLDGMPDTWEIVEFGDLTKDGTDDTDGDGYTDVEEYLNLIDGDAVTIDVTGVTVTPALATINIPDTITLTKTVLPADASNQSGVWSSSDESIATVNNNGVVTPVSEGEVIITFNTNSGGFSDSATITVTNIPIAVESVSLSPETLELNINVTGELIATVLPFNATNQTGVWSSSNTAIASVNQEGVVQPLSVGETTITFTTNDGGYSASSTVTINDNNYGTYEFYNADTDNLIQLVDGGEVFDLDIIGDNINFRSIPANGDGNPNVESVGVVWSGAESGTYGESAPIYAGMNQHSGSNYYPYTVLEGTYNFTVNYYSENSYGGTIVATDTFEVTFVRGNYVSAGDDASICIGDTQLLTASGAESYLWSTGESSESIAVTPNTTTTYTVTGTHSDGSTSTDSVIVVVNETPVVDAGIDQTICEGESITLTATASVGTIVWSNGATTSSITVSPSNTVTYNVVVNNNGCISSDEVTVNVIEAPIINISNDITIPLGQSTILSVSGGVSYLWSTGEITDSITVAPTTTSTYSVTVTNGNDCSDTANVTVTVVGPVVADAGDDVSICEGESIVLSASGGDTYLWSNGETTQNITVNPENTSSYSVTVSDAYTSDADSVLVTVNPVPVVDAGDDITINQGESVTLYASGGNTYLWSTGDSNANISVSPSETTTYSVTTTINGCSDTDDVTVTVITLIQASAGDDQSICLGGETTLTADGGDTYLWSTGETTQSILVGPSIDTNYTVTVTNQYGSDSDEVRVEIDENCPVLDFEFIAYPNPTNGIINVKISGLEDSAVLQVTDILGKQLKYIEVNPNSGQITNKQIDISGMTKGFYLLTFYGDNRVITKKILLK